MLKISSAVTSSKGSLHGWGTGTGKELSAFTTQLNSFRTLRAPQNNGDLEKSFCSVEEQFPLRGTTWTRTRAHTVSFHVHCEFVWQAELQISTLEPRSTCEWRQSEDERSIMKQAGTITNCQHRYSLGNMFWGTEELWTVSSWDLTQPSQQSMSLRKCCPDLEAKRSQTDLPPWRSDRKQDWISSRGVIERKKIPPLLIH